MSNDQHVNDAAVAQSRSPYRGAYQLMLAEAQAVPMNELISAPTDVDNLTATVINRLPIIAELDADAAVLPKFGLYDYQQLPTRVFALAQAEKEYKIALSPPLPIEGKLDELTHVRKSLLAHGEVLVIDGHISAAPIESLKFNVSQRELATNTGSVAVYLINSWDKIAPHTTLKLEELYAYERLADEVHHLVCSREEQPKKIEKAALIRRQLFTLVFRSLRQVERAALYYYEENADKFVPDVFANLGKHGARAAEPEAPAEVGAPVAPVAPAAPVAPVSVTAAPAAEPAAPIPVGMPGANPYMR